MHKNVFSFHEMSRKLGEMGDNESEKLLNPIEKLGKLGKEIVIGIPDDLETTFQPEECIYRVPAALRDLNKAAYTPRVISIGPIHHETEKLEVTEIQKRRYLKEFCKRLSLNTEEQREKFLTGLLQSINDQEADIRRRYAAGSFKQDFCDDRPSPKFAKMILFDAVFIFELFLRNEELLQDNNKYQDDFVVGKPWLKAAIQRDLILLENQLPFSVLEKLYRLATANSKINCCPFLDLSCDYFKRYNKNKPSPVGASHFTDLVRYFLSFRHPELTSPDEEPIRNLYSVTRLKRAGIKFRAWPAGECLLDIRAWNSTPGAKGDSTIKKGELHMPPLEIDNNTECLFRNLMALEQCHYPREEYICRYVKLLDCLVDVEKDVNLLVKKKIIVSKLGDTEAVAKLINKLCLEIVEVPSGYNALSKQLNDYYESSWNKNKAYLASVYFKNVWIGTGSVVGLIILAITVMRFIFYFLR